MPHHVPEQLRWKCGIISSDGIKPTVNAIAGAYTPPLSSPYFFSFSRIEPVTVAILFSFSFFLFSPSFSVFLPASVSVRGCLCMCTHVRISVSNVCLYTFVYLSIFITLSLFPSVYIAPHLPSPLHLSLSLPSVSPNPLLTRARGNQLSNNNN